MAATISEDISIEKLKDLPWTEVWKKLKDEHKSIWNIFFYSMFIDLECFKDFLKSNEIIFVSIAVFLALSEYLITINYNVAICSLVMSIFLFIALTIETIKTLKRKVFSVWVFYIILISIIIFLL